MKPIGVIITGGDSQALGALRTLAKKGIPTVLTDWDFCVGRFSKYVTKSYRSPNPQQEEEYVAFLISLAQEKGYHGWMLCANSDDVVYLLSKHKATLEQYFLVPNPPLEVIQKLHVKLNTYKIAHEHGLPHPKTYFHSSLEELLTMPLEYPLCIKPSIRDNFYSKVKIKAFLVKDEKELIDTYNYVSTVIDPSEILVQEMIPSGRPLNLYSAIVFFKDDEIISGITVRRIRQHPMDFGHATTYAKVIDLPILFETAQKFLSIVGYYGIAEVEFMHDVENDIYKLLEVNPRICGWHSLSIAAGADLPYYLFADMTQQEFEVNPEYKKMTWVKLLTDIPTVFLEVIRGNMSIGEYAASMRGSKEFAVFRWSDPLPFIAEVLMIPYLWIKRGF